MLSSNPAELSTSAAVNWLATLMLGSIGTAIAILAVAGIGIAMLLGRLPVRRGGQMVIGCFILFSSHVIASGLWNMGHAQIDAPIQPANIEAPAYVAQTPPPTPYDPYAGASVPVRPPDSAGNLLPH
jgi:type IV secretory pathway VirB2 component (pilin)